MTFFSRGVSPAESPRSLWSPQVEEMNENIRRFKVEVPSWAEEERSVCWKQSYQLRSSGRTHSSSSSCRSTVLTPAAFIKNADATRSNCRAPLFCVSWPAERNSIFQGDDVRSANTEAGDCRGKVDTVRLKSKEGFGLI